jgi:hypothetical protein
VSDSTKRTVKFHLTGGGEIEIDMTPQELADALRSVDRDGLVGTFNRDQGTQVWIRGQHVVGATYPLDMGVDWLSLRDEANEPRRWKL